MTITDICQKYKVYLIDASSCADPAYRDRGFHFAYTSTMVLGPFTDEHRKVMVCLHEIGHMHETVANLPVYERESRAWTKAYGMAIDLGISINGATRKWCEEQLASYDKPKYR